MDLLNDEYPLYPIHSDNEYVSDSEKELIEEYIDNVEKSNYKKLNHPKNITSTITTTQKKSNGSKLIGYDVWYTHYSDDLWYFWCMCNEFTVFNMLPFLERMDYPSFCKFCYNNSNTK